MTSHYGLTEIINEPTYILENYSSCIDLVFTSQANIVVDNEFILIGLLLYLQILSAARETTNKECDRIF